MAKTNMATPSTPPRPSSGKPAARHSLISDDTLQRMYSAMLGCRALQEHNGTERHEAERTISSASSTTRSAVGQEAVVVGATLDLNADDTITAPSGEVILRAAGRQQVSRKARPERALTGSALYDTRRDVIAFAASSGAQLTIGTGIALVNQDGGNRRVVVAFGDADAPSIASWNEALHIAGLHRLPIVFVLRHALPPVSTRKETGQYNATVNTICQSAQLAGIITIPVDFTDVIAMYRVSFEAIARARKSTGATLIVSTLYAADGQRAARAEDTDPIIRMETYLAGKGLFSKKWKAGLLRQFS